ncbi:MAG: twin-arginine translocation signal domain-containing protein, partial [Candidatus Caldarchaeum sp.]|nr:twin-arginine translocation signal domain-containing protein [Candidatus Caldarchaeum sp.]MDW8434807.1 twin-arginine translocation signal domain-containing protein [Candidatus Caldarchaeum sp.]
MSQTITIKRRDFLKAATSGTTALTTLSLTGISIKSARALPPTKAKLLEGQKIPSVCPYCAVGCTVIGTVVDGRVVDVAPDLEAPHTEGTLCSKGQASMMLLPQYNPYRLRRPLMRTNPRKGENEDPMWREITWEEAFRIIIEKY